MTRVFEKYFSVSSTKIKRTENGKPYLESENGLFFSVSHTDSMLFIAVSDCNVGLDAENEDRKVNYTAIVKKFSLHEQSEIVSNIDFLKNFTAKESAVKFLGGKLALDLNKLQVINGEIVYNNSPLPAILSYPVFDGYILAVCCEKDFSSAEFIPL